MNFLKPGIVKKGSAHGIGLIVLVIVVNIICSKFALSSKDSGGIAELTYLAAVGLIGFFWKKRNGKTFSLIDGEANKDLFSYSLGAITPLVLVLTVVEFNKISAVGDWWPLFMLFLIPFGLFSQALNFAAILAMGGWFYKNNQLASQSISLIAVFNHNREALLLKRPDNVHCGSLWSFPGGKVETGETPLDAAKRELTEETGLTGQNWHLLGEHHHAYPDRTLHFHLFGCDGLNPDSLNSNEAHVWVSADKLGEYSMPKANRALLDILFGQRIA